ncbi:magnesium-translocating P-type ATPase [Leptospira sp. 'Mane']|uniref:magnesium-translocating P-type ATPase n=1 Tax=Leptospira sp. 'Mane' TaxID=3387407 RepID=UPI00398A553B
MNSIPLQTFPFWSLKEDEIFSKFETSRQGLSSAKVKEKSSEYDSKRFKKSEKNRLLPVLLSQFKSPLLVLLLFAAILSFFLHESVNAVIIISIVIVSGVLGFWQEFTAANAIGKLISMVQVKTTVLRDNQPTEIALEGIIPGDILILKAGDAIAGDSYLIEAKDLFIEEASLTGETFPVEKSPSVLAEESGLAQRTNCLWMGTHVVTGSGKAVVVKVGKDTEFGKVSESLKVRPEETEFERGIRRFGNFLMEVTLVLVIAIFGINVYLDRPVLDSFLFSIALAVGLTPQLLPAIISINLSHGAKEMAKAKVIVKKLSSIENFGSMNVLCSDKTGTLTEGSVRLHHSFGVEGEESEDVFLHAYLNAYFESGFINPIDEAIRNAGKFDISGYEKKDEIPYDFNRKRLSILAWHKDSSVMITKGAVKNILEVCSKARLKNGSEVDIREVEQKIKEQFEKLSNDGFRTLGLAIKNLNSNTVIHKEDEKDMVFIGFLTLLDPLKENVLETIKTLGSLGVSLKVITGDNKNIAAHLSREMGLKDTEILTGSDLNHLSDTALQNKVGSVEVFAEIEPNQKERIILALKKAGNVVGYIGDGINDASALHVADVGISVDSAVDVAKDAADIVLLEKDLSVLIEGVKKGRTTFANTLKYVFMATSANFGNMFSMAGVSLFLPFLPLLPKQILLTNLLTDFPEMTIATDKVDKEMIDFPERWDIKAIQRFMITFGLVSSIFDYLTFGTFLLLLDATELEFRTGWFVESVISASFIVLIIRTRKSIFESRPGKYLLAATLCTAIATLALPYTPLAPLFGFAPLPWVYLLAIAILISFYMGTAEVVKRIFFRKKKI